MEVSSQPHGSATLPRGWENALYPLNKRLVGLHNQSVRFGEEADRLLLPRIERHVVQPLAYWCRIRKIRKWFLSMLFSFVEIGLLFRENNLKNILLLC
jgi:hypothetical protein